MHAWDSHIGIFHLFHGSLEILFKIGKKWINNAFYCPSRKHSKWCAVMHRLLIMSHTSYWILTKKFCSKLNRYTTCKGKLALMIGPRKFSITRKVRNLAVSHTINRHYPITLNKCTWLVTWIHKVNYINKCAAAANHRMSMKPHQPQNGTIIPGSCTASYYHRDISKTYP